MFCACPFSKEARLISLLASASSCVWEVTPASAADFSVHQDIYDGPPDPSFAPSETSSVRSSPALSATRGAGGLPASLSTLSLDDSAKDKGKGKGPNSSASSLANGAASGSSSRASASAGSCRVAFVNEQVNLKFLRSCSIQATDRYNLSFCWRQVCHHPPISAFWYESTSSDSRASVQATGVDQIAAKFNGTSVRIAAGSQNKGIFVRIPELTDDEYRVSNDERSRADMLVTSSRKADDHVGLDNTPWSIHYRLPLSLAICDNE